jgi:hypothetical protein
LGIALTGGAAGFEDSEQTYSSDDLLEVIERYGAELGDSENLHAYDRQLFLLPSALGLADQ